MKRTDVTDGIMQATFEIGRSLRRRMLSSSNSDMHMGQLHCLGLVQEQDGITMKEIATMLQIASPSATSFVDRLVQLGYVLRKQDQKNRKLVRLTITTSGKRILKEKMAGKKKMFQGLLRALSKKDQQTLLTILHIMLKSCQNS